MRMRSAQAGVSMSVIALVGVAGLWLATSSAGAKAPVTARHAVAAAVERGTAYGCAGNCFSLYSRELGTGKTMSVLIPADNGRGGAVGRRLNLSTARNHQPDSNFIPAQVGQVRQFCGAQANKFFSPTAYVCAHYARFWMFEATWAPFGNESDLCAGVAVAGRANQAVTLQRCGTSDRTLWILDRANGLSGDCRSPGNFCPWVSASNAPTGPPLVLTLAIRSPDLPDQLKIEPLQLAGRTAGRDQEFAYFWGPVI
jgi:hypothetical protein